MNQTSKLPGKENLLLQHLSKLEMYQVYEDSKNYGSQFSLNLDAPQIDMPTEPKRRRMIADDARSQIGSERSSPTFSENHLDDSLMSTPSASPSGTLKEHFRRKYRKDELWASIETNYKYLMDKEIIEACQSQDMELADEFTMSSISFNDFYKQYKEITEWLTTIQAALQRKVSTTLTLSTKYLNQSYCDEMERSPRLHLIKDYADHLKVCQPVLAEEVDIFVKEVQSHWETVYRLVMPTYINKDPQSLIKDLETDLECLRQWLDGKEDHLKSQLTQDWPFEELEIVLKDHKVLQQEIESHSRVISAVLKLSDSIQDDNLYHEHDTLETAAHTLEHRWHEIWLQSLEWQCRVEDAISKNKGIFNNGHNFDLYASLKYYTDDDDEYDCHDVMSGGEDSFTGVTYRGDFVQSPAKCDSSTCLSPDFDTTSGKDSAVVSETEQKTNSDMSENYQDLSLSTGSDSDRDVRKLKTDCRDVGYGSESQSDDLEGHAAGITFNSINSKASKKSSAEYYATVAVDTGSTTDKTEGCISASAEQTDGESSDIGMQIQEALKQEEPEMEDIRFLIDQADIMVQHGNAYNKTFSPKRTADGKRDAAAELHTESLSSSSSCPIREMVDKGVGTVESSCDASDEESGESDYQLEYETETIDSVIASEYTSDEMKYCKNDCTNLPKLYDTNNLRTRIKGQKKDRPWSVVELPNITEVKQLSASESAIDKLSAALSDSDIPPHNYTKISHSLSPTLPCHRNRRSHCNRRTVTNSYRSQIGTKRKLELDIVITPIVNSSGMNSVNSTLADNVTVCLNQDLTPQSECKYNSKNLCLTSDMASSGNTNVVPIGAFYPSEDELMTSMAHGNDLISTLQNARFNSSGSSYDDTDNQGDPTVVSGIDDGNFSENAWDNYQAPLYANENEDPPEEPLSWEPGEMEFDDEFSMPKSTIVATLLAHQSEEESTTSNMQPSLVLSSKANFEDSDSDIEDLHHVLEESCMQLKVADRSLKKKRRDSLKTGLYLNPKKYDELLATIETNMRCLEAICQHLDKAAVSEVDIEKMQVLLYQWERLHELAFDRRNQSLEVKTMYATFLSVNSTIKCLPEINKKFKSIEDLPTNMADIQDKEKFIHCQKQMLNDLRIAVKIFSSQNSSVNVDYFLSQIQETDNALCCLLLSCRQMQSKLSQTHPIWLEYNAAKTELDFLLSQDLELLRKLQSSQMASDAVCKSQVEEQIKKIISNLDQYNEKLIALRCLHANLMEVTDSEVQLDDCLDHTCNLLYMAKQICNDIMVANAVLDKLMCKEIEQDSGMDDKMEVKELNTVLTEPQKLRWTEPKPTSKHQPKSQQKIIYRVLDWLKSFPIQAVTIAVLIGLLYLFSPNILHRLMDFTLRFTPKLDYVDGPPPM